MTSEDRRKFLQALGFGAPAALVSGAVTPARAMPVGEIVPTFGPREAYETFMSEAIDQLQKFGLDASPSSMNVVFFAIQARAVAAVLAELQRSS
jgi:hypothetical protein